MSVEQKSKKDEKRDFDRWLAYTFTRMNTSDAVSSWIHEKLKRIYRFDRDESFLQKIKKMRRLKKTMFIDPVNYICTVLTARSLKTDVSANYGFIYSSDVKYNNKYMPDKFTKNPVCISYCIAPSLMSTDGEYRNRLFKFGQFLIIDERYSGMMEWLEKSMVHKIERYDLSLETENFYPQIGHEYLAEQLDHYLVEHAVLLKFFAIFWLIEVYNRSVDMQENHINPKFNQIFFSHLDEDLKEFASLKAKFGEKLVLEMVHYCTSPIMQRATDKALYTVPHSVGQKLQPLNVGEVQEPLNIYFSPWREIYLSSLASDLLANLICPSFAIFVDWFYIKNSKKGLFDNEQQYQKIEFSERALVITKKLRETQRITYTRDPKTDERVPLNAMFRELHDKIEDPVDFAKAHLLMSNVTLGFATENVGRTFADIPILEKSKKWISRVGSMRDDWVFRKYAWDMCYGLLCLNTKLGITHSDLHLNNGTINDIDTPVMDPKARVLYQINGLWYALRTHGPYACIIDFSRGTILPQKVEKYQHWPDRQAYEDFVDAQNRAMIRKLEDTVPTFMKINRDKVVELQRDHFMKFYKLYTAVDPFDFFSRVSKGLNIISAKSKALTDKITKISEHYLTNIMIKVLTNPDLEVEWPLQVILRECFTDEIFNPTIPQKDWFVTDMWLYDRPDVATNLDRTECAVSALPYTLSSFACWPPILKTEYGLPAKKEGDETLPENETGKYRIQSVAHMDATRQDYERYRREQMKMVHYIAQRHQEKYA
jgi:hypothetical protein